MKRLVTIFLTVLVFLSCANRGLSKLPARAEDADHSTPGTGVAEAERDPTPGTGVVEAERDPTPGTGVAEAERDPTPGTSVAEAERGGARDSAQAPEQNTEDAKNAEAAKAAEAAEDTEGSGDTASRGAKPKGRVAKGVEYWFYAAVSLLSVLCMAYLLCVLNKERKSDDG